MFALYALSWFAVSATALAPTAPRPTEGSAGRPDAPAGEEPAAVPVFHWIDYDADGLPDLYLAGAAGGDRLLHNRGGGELEDVTRAAGLALLEGSRLAAWADYDGDGLPDLYRAARGAPGILLRNAGAAGFVEVTASVGITHAGADVDLRWIDYDLDARPDLEVRTDAGAHLYHNVEGAAFERLDLEDVVQGALGAGPAAARGSEPAGAVLAEPAAGARQDGTFATEVAGPPTRPDGAPQAEVGTLAPPATGAAADRTDQVLAICADTLLDQALGTVCLGASSVPTLGMLYPLSAQLFVSAAGNVGIGTTTPGARLDVNGTLRTLGFTLPTGAGSGRVLTSSASGSGSWQLLPTYVGGGGTTGRLMKFSSPTTATDSNVYESGSGFVGVGEPTPLAGLHVTGGPIVLGTERRVTALLEGDGANGSGGSLVFGTGGNQSYLTENASDQMEFIAEGGVGFGPGNVGIGVAPQSHKLAVASTTEDALRLIGPDGSFGHGAQLNFGDGDYAFLEEDADDHLQVHARLGTKVTSDAAAPSIVLEVESSAGGGITTPALRARNTSSGAGIALHARSEGTDGTLIVTNSGTGSLIRGFNVGSVPVFEVQNDGRVVAPVVEITGGSDVAEGFELRDDDAVPGTVVVIDPEAEGELRVSGSAYDRRVAGVVSGAGGVRPGLSLGQSGELEGSVPVAMSGRVYVRCTAAGGAIRPGDLLTTAPLRGHAMRAGDPQRAFGAVLGKALSSLDEGTGLVLVLVNLQ